LNQAHFAISHRLEVPELFLLRAHVRLTSSALNMAQKDFRTLSLIVAEHLEDTPPHPTLAFPFNVLAFPINVMAFPITVKYGVRPGC